MSRASTWNRIIEISHSMQSCARQGKWEEVQDMEVSRREIMLNFFSTTASVDEAEWISRGIREVLEIDREIMDLGKKNLHKLSQQIQNLKVGEKVEKAYRAFA